MLKNDMHNEVHPIFYIANGVSYRTEDTATPHIQ